MTSKPHHKDWVSGLGASSTLTFNKISVINTGVGRQREKGGGGRRRKRKRYQKGETETDGGRTWGVGGGEDTIAETEI